ncbi:hypothetical protein AVEN_14635-1 [Araneus ventricosus]|uniref:Uncharacterized protein n=1 Tax=Araneus ventricosus TaxID=182803 RepID=A0A4Y2S973_ARAVE|nr:hypothetical protein AVEN_14635-1 [Araneus ventricosus]
MNEFNTLTPKPVVTGHSTSILVDRIPAGCCSERGEKADGRVVFKGTLRGVMRGLPFISPAIRSEEKRGNGVDESIPQITHSCSSVYNCTELLVVRGLNGFVIYP